MLRSMSTSCSTAPSPARSPSCIQICLMCSPTAALTIPGACSRPQASWTTSAARTWGFNARTRSGLCRHGLGLRSSKCAPKPQVRQACSPPHPVPPYTESPFVIWSATSILPRLILVSWPGRSAAWRMRIATTGIRAPRRSAMTTGRAAAPTTSISATMEIRVPRTTSVLMASVEAHRSLVAWSATKIWTAMTMTPARPTRASMRRAS